MRPSLSFSSNVGSVKNFQKNGDNHPPYPTRAFTLSSPQLTSKREIQYKRFIDAELQARRDKWLCYRCDEKFFVGHRCKARELRLLLASDDTELDNGDVESDDQEVTYKEEHVAELAELSLNTVVGFSDPGTMKVRGRVEQDEVIIFIDCGATHNFISHRVVERLKIPISETTNFGVSIGTGATVKGKSTCKGVAVAIGDHSIIANFLPLELGNIDMILGMQWLRTLGVRGGNGSVWGPTRKF